MEELKSKKLIIIGFILNFCVTFTLIWVVGMLWVLQFSGKGQAIFNEPLSRDGLISFDHLKSETGTGKCGNPVVREIGNTLADPDFRSAAIGINKSGFSLNKISILASDSLRLTVANYDSVPHTFGIDSGNAVNEGVINPNDAKTFYLGGFDDEAKVLDFYADSESNPKAFTGTVSVCK